jgi:RNA polymerase sigma factor (sigma-70 family)
VVTGLAADACEGLSTIARALDLKLCIATTSEQAMEMISGEDLACVFMHVCTLDATVVDRVASLRRDGIDVPIVVRALHAEPEAALDALRAGVDEVVRAGVAHQELECVLGRAIEAHTKRRAHEASVREVEQSLSRLSDREFQVLRLMLAGLGNKQIAHELGLSVKTIESHRARVLSKLEAENIAQYAYRLLRSLL